MKNLANCKPREFFTQTVKIRNKVESWLKNTNIFAMRGEIPELPKDATEAQKIVSDKVIEILGEMFEAVFDKHADETIEVLALLCFVEPEKANEHTMDEYFENIGEMLGSKGVLHFFTSLVRLAQMNI